MSELNLKINTFRLKLSVIVDGQGLSGPYGLIKNFSENNVPDIMAVIALKNSFKVRSSQSYEN